MIDQFVALCFRKRLVVRLLAIFACFFGVYSWTKLAIDAYPLLSPVSAQVTVQVPGLAAEEVEQQITIPLERGLNGTPGLTSIRSIRRNRRLIWDRATLLDPLALPVIFGAVTM